MRCDNGSCNTCRIVGIFASILLAIAVGLLSFFEIFAAPLIGYIAALVLGVLSGAGVIAVMAIRRREGAFSCCLCKNAGGILAGAVGSVLLSLAGIMVGTGLGAVVSALLAGFTAFFFFLLVSAIICFAVCLIDTCD